MEEKKQKSALTVEEVTKMANQQIQLLYKKLEESNLQNAYRRIDYLFRIVEGNFSKDIKDKALKEIDEVMFNSLDTKEFENDK